MERGVPSASAMPPQVRGSGRDHLAFFGRPLFWVVVVGTLFGLPLLRSLLRPRPEMPPTLATLPHFSFTRENGSHFGTDELHDKVWIAARFDRDDAGEISRAMHDLERRMRKLGESFELVSLGTSGETPAELAAYAQEHHTNPRRWALVTATSPDEARTFAAVRRSLELDSFKFSAPLALVDRQGHLRGVYDLSLDAVTAGRTDAKTPPPATMDQLVYDAALLVNGY
jgi:protein SCO1/2